MYCPKCKVEVKAGNQFCTKCGALAQQALYCVKCGEKIKDQNNFCTKCGTIVQKKTIKPQQSSSINFKNVLAVMLLLAIIVIYVFYADMRSKVTSNSVPPSDYSEQKPSVQPEPKPEPSDLNSNSSLDKNESGQEEIRNNTTPDYSQQMRNDAMSEYYEEKIREREEDLRRAEEERQESFAESFDYF